jgi:flagellar protein FliO/FliZ
VIELAVRLVFSLAVVVGLLLLVVRVGAKRFRGSADALVNVVHRQALSRTSAVAVVTVGSRVLVLGTTEQNVQLLTELDPEELVAVPALGVDPSPSADPVVPAVAAGGSGDAAVHDIDRAPRRTPWTARDTALAGSVLSADTWKQALAAATGKDREAS